MSVPTVGARYVVKGCPMHEGRVVTVVAASGSCSSMVEYKAWPYGTSQPIDEKFSELNEHLEPALPAVCRYESEAELRARHLEPDLSWHANHEIREFMRRGTTQVTRSGEDRIRRYLSKQLALADAAAREQPDAWDRPLAIMRGAIEAVISMGIEA